MQISNVIVKGAKYPLVIWVYANVNKSTFSIDKNSKTNNTTKLVSFSILSVKLNVVNTN